MSEADNNSSLSGALTPPLGYETSESTQDTSGTITPINTHGPQPNGINHVNKLVLKRLVDKVIPRKKMMPSLRYLYRIGLGPSSSHTMGPRYAAERFHKKHPDVKSVVCELCGSLSLTGKGHFTDKAIENYYESKGIKCRVDFTDKKLEFHTNGMIFRGYDEETPGKGVEIATYVCFSVGGGQIVDQSNTDKSDPERFMVYPFSRMSQILEACRERGLSLDEYVLQREAKFDEELKKIDPDNFVPFKEYMGSVLDAMFEAIDRGLRQDTHSTGILPGSLHYRRRAPQMYHKALMLAGRLKCRVMPMIYATAVGEENASMGKIVTAPTCGSSGVIPAVLRHLREDMPEATTREHLIRALSVAGIIGNLAKANASISGATLGCQAEIGVACAMASAAACYLEGGSNELIERAAEIGLEHNLGLTCDPVAGYVIIPCIQRNGVNATRALVCADIAVLTSNASFISLDSCIEAMRITGLAMLDDYKETAIGGLAQIVRNNKKKDAEKKISFDAFIKSFLKMEKSSKCEELGLEPSVKKNIFIPLDNCPVPEKKLAKLLPISSFLSKISGGGDEGDEGEDGGSSSLEIVREVDDDIERKCEINESDPL